MTNEMYMMNVTKLYDVFYNSYAKFVCESNDDMFDYLKRINKIIMLCEKYDLHVVDVNNIDFDKSRIIYDCETFYIVNNNNEIVATIDIHFDYYNVNDCMMFYDCETIYDNNNNEYYVCDEKIVDTYEQYYDSLK